MTFAKDDPFKNIRGETIALEEGAPEKLIEDSVEESLLWEVDYGDQESFGGVPFKTTANLAGVHMMVINDHKNVFYPIM